MLDFSQLQTRALVSLDDKLYYFNSNTQLDAAPGQSDPWQSWSQLCQQELKLPAGILKYVQKWSWHSFNFWIKPWNSPCCWLLVRTGWTQNLHFFLFLFRNIRNSSSSFDADLIFSQCVFWGEIFCRSAFSIHTRQVHIQEILNFLLLFHSVLVAGLIRFAASWQP